MKGREGKKLKATESENASLFKSHFSNLGRLSDKIIVTAEASLSPLPEPTTVPPQLTYFLTALRWEPNWQ